MKKENLSIKLEADTADFKKGLDEANVKLMKRDLHIVMKYIFGSIIAIFATAFFVMIALAIYNALANLI